MLCLTCVLKFVFFVSRSSSLVQVTLRGFFSLLFELSFINTHWCLATAVMAVGDLFRNGGVQSLPSRNAVLCSALSLVLA